MPHIIQLPTKAGKLEAYHLSGKGGDYAKPATPPNFNRVAYAAAHVVVDPLKDSQPWGSRQ